MALLKLDEIFWQENFTGNFIFLTIYYIEKQIKVILVKGLK